MGSASPIWIVAVHWPSFGPCCSERSSSWLLGPKISVAFTDEVTPSMVNVAWGRARRRTRT
jgi:hypothetical protein